MERLVLPDEQPGGNYSKQRMFTRAGGGAPDSFVLVRLSTLGI